MIYISPTSYPVGYCVYVKGGTITSPPGAPYLTVDNVNNGASGSTVIVRIEPGGCVDSF